MSPQDDAVASMFWFKFTPLSFCFVYFLQSEIFTDIFFPVCKGKVQ